MILHRQIIILSIPKPERFSITDFTIFIMKTFRFQIKMQRKRHSILLGYSVYNM